jgi:hypothetical protein
VNSNPRIGAPLVTGAAIFKNVVIEFCQCWLLAGMKPVNGNEVALCSAGQRVRTFIPVLCADRNRNSRQP